MCKNCQNSVVFVPVHFYAIELKSSLKMERTRWIGATIVPQLNMLSSHAVSYKYI